MKTKHLTAMVTGILIFANISMAISATCTIVTCPPDKIPTLPAPPPECKNDAYSFYCYYNKTGNIIGPFINCSSGCANGYTQNNEYFVENNLPGCSSSISPIPIQCASNVQLCGTCESTAWSEIPSIPYATRTKKYCDGPTCKSENEVACKKGYYGTPKQIGSGCTACLSSGGKLGTTDAIGAQDITECYLPSGSTFSDSNGSGIYIGKCYYKK